MVGYGVPMQFIESEGGVPSLTKEYDVIIAMDSLEHIENWREALASLGNHLRPDGVLFSNNGILDDMTQPEHYELRPSEFIKACVDSNLMPTTQLSYIKKEEVVCA